MAKEKFCLLKLRPYLEESGKTFSQFMDAAGTPPSRRAWADGTKINPGVTRVTISRMIEGAERAFKKWEEFPPTDVLEITQIN